MKKLNLEDILNAPALPIVEVPVPEWGEDAVVCMRGMSGEDREVFESSLKDRIDMATGRIKDLRGLRYVVLHLTMVTEDGTRMFVSQEAAAQALGGKSGVVLDRLFAEASRISGIDSAAERRERETFFSPQSAGSGSS